ncbi:MAG: hypothetical protein Q8S33_35005 [Myxococcales bacterium]|nr:hypothetical protein [Myxococcales bacterium]
MPRLIRVVCPIVALALFVAACASEKPPAVAVRRDALDGGSAPTLSSTRQLRRLFLTLRGREPTLAEYQAAQAAELAGTQTVFYDAQVTAALSSPEFASVMLAFGHDYLKIGDYQRGSTEGGFTAWFKGSQAVPLLQCPVGTLHAGKYGFWSDLSAVTAGCGNAALPEASAEPWWAPGSMVTVVGQASLTVRTAGQVDCGVVNMGDTSARFPAAGCGCGPNFLYCYPDAAVGISTQYPSPKQANPLYADTFRRLLQEEPARLFQYIATNDVPFTDLIMGDYTVAPRWLQFLYVRWGRSNVDNAMMDSSAWFRAATTSWDRVTFHSLHPNLLADRGYRFDPRTTTTLPQGIPSAGVLTMLGPNSWYPRERVRGARYLETFACKVFSAPDPNMVFTPPYTNDPRRQGACQHCHVDIEPAAIHFKRLEIEDTIPKHGQGYVNLGGIGGWSWGRSGTTSFADANSPGGRFWYQPYGRWNVAFLEGTMLTPVAAGGIATNPDARFIDFLEPGETLLGQTSDGTIGPLGFSKLIVQSGAFDRCAVDRLFERVMGFSLSDDPNRETALVQRFVAGQRRVRPFIESLVKEPDFSRGR